MNFSESIIKWYNKNKRNLPWRNTRNPYLIWLSEVILQQTKVEQGLPYYIRFRQKYPTVTLLAKASEKEVLKLWQGLGYYSRARNLHATAKKIVSDYEGTFPSSYSELLQLNGIGRYTAAAIASFAFGEAKAVVDGNVFRLLSRYFAVKTPIDSSIGKNSFYSLAENLLDKENPATFNQAIMEFGAMQCVPKNPNCTACPLAASCLALAQKKVSAFPVKQKKIKLRTRWFYYLVIKQNNKLLMKRRTGNDIWKGLYDFPLIETDKKTEIKKILSHSKTKKLLGSNFHVIKISAPHSHLLSHQKLHSVFIEIIPKTKVRNKNLVPYSSDFAVPRLIEKYLYSQ